MAPGRSRTSRRNTSSYTSTITVIAFITLCMLGVWMLTSSSLAPPKTTTRTGETTATDDNEASSSSSSSNQAQNIESVTKKDQHIFEDNPGDLPDDAIKSDEPKSNGEGDGDGGNKEKREPEGHSKAVEEKGSQQVSLGEEKSRDLDAKESAEEGEKQGGEQSQLSELESTVTQNQQAESISQDVSESEGSQTSNEETRINEEQGTTSLTSENSQESEANRLGMDQNQNEELQQQIIEDVESSKTTQDSQNQVAIEDKQEETPQEKDESDRNNQDLQNLDSYQKQQEEQRKEDAGAQSTLPEPQNEISEEDQQQRLKQQRQQQQQDQETKESSANNFNQAFGRATEDMKTYEDNEKAQQESQGGESNSSQEAGQDTTMEEKAKDSKSTTSFPEGGNPGIPKESRESKKTWSTQASDSENQKERRKEVSQVEEGMLGFTWDLCNNTAGPDYIPCLDNEKAVKKLRTTRHFEHRERHCPEVGPTCLVPLPEGYKTPVQWPQSRDKIWYHNVPHTTLAEVKGHQNWVKVSGEFLTFPGGGTQFIHGAMHYIDFVEKAVPNIAWGKHTRVILDVGCGVASFGGYLFEKDVLAMSFAPKDEHEAQVQFALERGIPAISAVMGSQRLPFPSRVFDLIHCARCRVPWHLEGGKLLLELNRVLRPGGYFVWSATPVYQKLEEDVEIWQAMSALTVSMCWELVTIKKDKLNSIGAAIYRKPTTNDCYDQRKKKSPPICKSDDDPSAAWYVPLQACMHRVPTDENERGAIWPEEWPLRLQTPPYWLNNSQLGIYGRPAPEDFMKDYVHWRNVVNKSYMKGFGISWDNVRNVMDMRAVYGGFAAALRDRQVWVLNVVNIDSPDTLPIIYERGLIGIYHDWCESFSTYPRSYDLLHADHLFSMLKKRCKLAPVMAEVDRIVRPGGKIIIRDESSAIGEVENLLKSLRWEVHLTFSKDQEGLLSAQKGNWRPVTYESAS